MEPHPQTHILAEQDIQIPLIFLSILILNLARRFIEASGFIDKDFCTRNIPHMRMYKNPWFRSLELQSVTEKNGISEVEKYVSAHSQMVVRW